MTLVITLAALWLILSAGTVWLFVKALRNRKEESA